MNRGSATSPAGSGCVCDAPHQADLRVNPPSSGGADHPAPEPGAEPRTPGSAGLLS
ncbi:unnamed protein product [Lepidochelys kempii]